MMKKIVPKTSNPEPSGSSNGRPRKEFEVKMKYLFVAQVILLCLVSLFILARGPVPQNMEEVDRYIVTIEIKQTHFTLDLFEHAKDAINAIQMSIPVDKSFYDSVNVGTVLDNSFRGGSFIVNGSLGSWNIKVVKKEVQRVRVVKK